MNQKKFILVFFACFLILSATSLAKKSYIEYLGWYQIPTGNYGFLIEPTNVTIKTDFDSSSFLTFSVPASKKYGVIFIDHFAEALFKCSDFSERQVYCKDRLSLTSSAIPSDVEVYTERVVAQMRETNLSGDSDTSSRRSWKRDPIIMRRDSLDWWSVKYSSTGDYVPEADALNILNNIMDAGFTVDISTHGSLKGVDYFYLYFCMITVTRVAK